MFKYWSINDLLRYSLSCKNVYLWVITNDVNLLAPELFFLISAHLYIKCE